MSLIWVGFEGSNTIVSLYTRKKYVVRGRQSAIVSLPSPLSWVVQYAVVEENKFMTKLLEYKQLDSDSIPTKWVKFIRTMHGALCGRSLHDIITQGRYGVRRCRRRSHSWSSRTVWAAGILGWSCRGCCGILCIIFVGCLCLLSTYVMVIFPVLVLTKWATVTSNVAATACFCCLATTVPAALNMKKIKRNVNTAKSTKRFLSLYWTKAITRYSGTTRI